MTSQPDPKEQPELYPVTERLHALPGLADNRGERRRARVTMVLASFAILAVVAVLVMVFR